MAQKWIKWIRYRMTLRGGKVLYSIYILIYLYIILFILQNTPLHPPLGTLSSK
ncbi:hypothetical protein HWC07_gp122 [Pantoea phage vB_PagM_LIET2]|uniref:Uncharacterized protein n=1 Tax=Pantoea phage vB_PagM_LIET2 TaxID=2508071 RepID=A0A411AWA1_9CAUD|nr:hypothetical protein HWC07_gp122 [Pantoea phage vB_PagM_LIET2]QAX92374.1 hypothetical protein LIET2_gp122 [Pantoea phage vB_PagM_LIET2]